MVVLVAMVQKSVTEHRDRHVARSPPPCTRPNARKRPASFVVPFLVMCVAWRTSVPSTHAFIPSSSSVARGREAIRTTTTTHKRLFVTSTAHRRTLLTLEARLADGDDYAQQDSTNTDDSVLTTDASSSNNDRSATFMNSLLSYFFNFKRLQSSQDRRGVSAAAKSLGHFLDDQRYDASHLIQNRGDGGAIAVGGDTNDGIRDHSTHHAHHRHNRQHQQHEQQHHHQQQHRQFEQIMELDEMLSRTLSLAFRVLADIDDFKSIQMLLDASIRYADSNRVLTPRLFGEAIHCISQTNASLSKIKRVWSLVSTEEATAYLTAQPSSLELNAILQAVASQGSIGSCLNILARHERRYSRPSDFDTNDYVSILPDSYTVVIALNALAKSITPEQPAARDATAVPSLAESMSSLSSVSTKDIHPGSSLFQKLRAITSQSAESCWQWKEALKLIRIIENDENKHDGVEKSELLNNYGMAALLDLNIRVPQQVDGHDSAAVADVVMNHMMANDITPDVVICTSIIKAYGNAKSGHDAFDSMMRLLNTMINDPSYPKPNAFTYSAAIATCGKLDRAQKAVELLRSMTRGSQSQTQQPDSFTPPQPNAWVYNNALTAIQKSSTTPPARRKRLSLEILEEMIQNSSDEHRVDSRNCAPNVVTFGAILSTLASSELKGDDSLVFDLLAKMGSINVPNNSFTYRNALLALSESDNVMQVLAEALDEADQDDRIARSLDIPSLFRASFTSIATNGDVDAFRKGLEQMEDCGIPIDRRTVSLLFKTILVLDPSCLPLVLKAWDGDDDLTDDEKTKLESRGLTNITEFIKPLQFAEYEISILLALGQMEVDVAQDLLTVMRQQGHTPSKRSMEKFAMAFSICATDTSRKHKQDVMSSKNAHSKDITLSQRYAKNAFNIVIALDPTPSTRIVGSVIKGCASAELWYEARKVLSLLHDQVLNTVTPKSPDTASMTDETTDASASAKTNTDTDTSSIASTSISDSSTTGAGMLTSSKDLEMVSNVHRTILRQCAQHGNVKAALRFVEDIQYLSLRLRRKSEKIRSGDSDNDSDSSDVAAEAALVTAAIMDSETSAMPLYGSVDADDSPDTLANGDFVDAVRYSASMRAEDWMQVTIAASKSGNWRVCINSLQFIRPFLQKTNPAEAETAADRSLFLARYQQISMALISASRCLERRSQYGWTVRTIDDWMEWSGRRPPHEAVLSACRVLSARDSGEETLQLVTRALAQPKDTIVISKRFTYEERLYVGAISALHRNGLYDEADELFESGLSDGHLTLQMEDKGDHFEVDLHGLNVAMAHCAVRVAMRRQYVKSPDNDADGVEATDSADATCKDMIVVTGRGRHSALSLKPVLRPEVQRMLLEEFYPPLNTMSVPSNMGALKVMASDIEAWQNNQSRQKIARLQTVASVLKNLSSVSRIQRTIEIAAAGQLTPDTTEPAEGAESEHGDNDINDSENPALQDKDEDDV